MQQTLRKVIFAAVFDPVHFDGIGTGGKSRSGYGSVLWKNLEYKELVFRKTDWSAIAWR
jgi:hypothetical protein